MGWIQTEVVAGIVIVYGTGSNTGVFVYSPTPALGNLIASLTSSAGFDAYGNEVLAGNVGYTFEASEPAYYGVVSSSNGIAIFRATSAGGPWSQMGGLAYVAVSFSGMQLYDQFSGASLTVGDDVDANGNVYNALAGILSLYPALGAPLPPSILSGSAGIYADTSGIPRAINGNDAEVYAVGQQVLISASDTSVTTTGDTQVNSLSTDVGAGSYKVRAILRCVAAASGTAQALRIGFTGTATLSGTRTFVKSYIEETATPLNAGNLNGLSVYYDTGSIANGTVFDIEVEGAWTFSAAGTFNLVAHLATSASSEHFTIQAHSFMELSPA